MYAHLRNNFFVHANQETGMYFCEDEPGDVSFLVDADQFLEKPPALPGYDTVRVDYTIHIVGDED